MQRNQADYKDIISAFEYVADRQADQVAFVYKDQLITYSRLKKDAQKLAGHLNAIGSIGKAVLVLNESSIEFVTSFLACLYAGSIPVPCYHPNETPLFKERFEVIVRKANIFAVLTNAINRDLAISLLAGMQSKVNWVCADALYLSQPPFCAGIVNKTAFIQFSSGSTDNPKGVIVTHANLLHNVQLIAEILCEQEKQDKPFIGVNWLPLYHDMGLIGACLLPLLSGFKMVLMPTGMVMEQPAFWLQCISDHQADMTLAPNFAYDRCWREVTDEQLQGLDLSSLSVAFNGGEKISPNTLIMFSEKMKPRGFSSTAFYPAYGLAEATLMVSASSWHSESVLHVEKKALIQNQLILSTHLAESVSLTHSGAINRDINIEIVDLETGTPLKENNIGHIMIASAMVAEGYCGDQDDHSVFYGIIPGRSDRYLQTGDIGFVRNGLLYVVDRLKDLIIINGKNIAPQIIENFCADFFQGYALGVNASFSVDNEGKEQIILVQEFDTPEDMETSGLAMKAALKSSLEIDLSSLVMVAKGAIPRTSIGKVSRKECKELYLQGAYETE